MTAMKWYADEIRAALETIDSDAIEKLVDYMSDCAYENSPVLVFGNGGSASTAEHFSCDHTKGISEDTHLEPHVVSLSSNMALITAIANDFDYSQIFSKQIEYYSRNVNDGGVAIGISASGNSRNILEGLKKARQMGYITAALVGFSGGLIKDANLADLIIHVKSDNYGVVEDCHSIIMHAVAQDIRKNNKIVGRELKL
jgi:D-sedoheptulose 7-phosphate isomerase/D-glycero-D-manno-heptose 1,7-bisphosphate phosphatase